MCYSAMVEQDFKKLGLKKGDWVDVSLFRDLFRRRFQGENIYVPRAMEANFLGSVQDPIEKEIKQLILNYRQKKTSEEEAKLFGYKKRLNEAEKKLSVKATKTATKEKEVCERQIEKSKFRLSKLNSDDLTEGDSRIFPMGWAPMIVFRDGHKVVVPARYHLRPQGQAEEFDQKYDGNYNARKESLEKVVWWKNVFGKNHGVFVVHKFFENVSRHKFEKRNLKKNEEEENMVLEFTPSDKHPMFVTVLYDIWPNNKKPEFYSAAAITMDPPDEIAETGHERCIIPIPEQMVMSWLEGGKALKEYYEILAKRVMPFYKHKIAA